MRALIRCRIKIKEDLEALIGADIPLIEKDYQKQIAAILAKMNEQNERLERNFFSVINFIVENNGVICFDYRDFSFESFFSIYINAKVPMESIEIIRSHPKVEFIEEA